MEVDGFAEKAHKDELSGRVGIQATGDEKVRDGDTVRSLGPHGRQRAEGGRGYVRADVVIDDDSEDNVEGGGEALERVGGLGGQSWVISAAYHYCFDLECMTGWRDGAGNERNTNSRDWERVT